MRSKSATWDFSYDAPAPWWREGPACEIRALLKPYPERPPAPAPHGTTAAVQARLIVWCRDCGHQVEPDPAEQAARYGADLPVRAWVKRLVCSQCGSRTSISY